MNSTPNTEDRVALRRHQLILLALTYRYMSYLFWLGVVALIATMVLLLHESLDLTVALPVVR